MHNPKKKVRNKIHEGAACLPELSSGTLVDVRKNQIESIGYRKQLAKIRSRYGVEVPL